MRRIDVRAAACAPSRGRCGRRVREHARSEPATAPPQRGEHARREPGAPRVPRGLPEQLDRRAHVERSAAHEVAATGHPFALGEHVCRACSPRCRRRDSQVFTSTGSRPFTMSRSRSADPPVRPGPCTEDGFTRDDRDAELVAEREDPSFAQELRALVVRHERAAMASVFAADLAGALSDRRRRRRVDDPSPPSRRRRRARPRPPPRRWSASSGAGSRTHIGSRRPHGRRWRIRACRRASAP